MGHFQVTQLALGTAHTIAERQCGSEITLFVTTHYPSDLRCQLLTDTRSNSIATAFTQSYEQ